MKVEVLVRLKEGVLDVQGKAVQKSLINQGHTGISQLRVGRLVEMDVEAADFDQAKSKVEKICQELLANTVIESFEIRAV